MVSTVTSFVSISKTAADTSQPITLDPISAYDVNIHCYDNSVYYGDGSSMGARMDPGDVAYFERVRLNDIFVKNVTAGSNGSIKIVASVPVEHVKEALKI